MSKFYKMSMLHMMNMVNFLSLCDECFRKVKVTFKSQRQFNPWITKGIRKSSKKKQKLCKMFLKKKNRAKWDRVQSI